MAEFSISFRYLAFPGDIDPSGMKPGDMPEMPVGERQLRRWLASGLLSGWAMLSGGTWGFCSGIVEHAGELHKQLGVREPPSPQPHLSGYMSVWQFRELLGVSSSRAYSILERHNEELGATKVEGIWNIPNTLTSEAVVAIIYHGSQNLKND
jgi:hypothetical protein